MFEGLVTRVSHLLFVYDAIIFVRAYALDCNTIMKILNTYEEAYG